MYPDSSSIPFDVATVKQVLPELRLDQPPVVPAVLDVYRRYYQLIFAGTTHHTGYFTVNGMRIAAHVIRPINPAGLVFVLHGYLDHVGYMGNLIRYLLECNYAVAAFDMPGHGLSEGSRSSIKDFTYYGLCFETFIALCREYISLTTHAIGFSTGASIMMEYLRRHSDLFVHKVFINPLVRSYAWYFSKIFYYIGKLFIKRLARVYRHDSHNKRFLAFRQYYDPLNPGSTCREWVKALFKWNASLRDFRLAGKVYIIQGSRDFTVQKDFNLPFLKKRIAETDITIIKHAGHQMLNESGPYLDRVFQVLDRIFTHS